MLTRGVRVLATMLGMGTVVAVALLVGLLVPVRGVAAQDDSSGALSLSVEGPGVACQAGACVVSPGSSFTLTVEVVEAPDAGYIGLGTQIVYQNLIYTPTEDKVDEMLINTDGYPGISVRSDQAMLVNHGQTAGTPPDFAASHYTGPAIQIALTCTDDYSRNEVELVAYTDDNTLGSGFKLPIASGGAVVSAGDSLLIHCGEPAPGSEGTEGPDGSETPGATLPPELDSPEERATATAVAKSTGTAVARATATAAAAVENGTDDDDGGSNTGLWIAIGAIAAVAVAIAGGGALYWRRTQR